MIAMDYDDVENPQVAEYMPEFKQNGQEPLTFSIEENTPGEEYFDIISSFMRIKVPHGKSYGVKQLVKGELEYDFIK